jgi:putative ATP-binding cassette transporter
VIATRPDWVFLDEATSALDLDSERKLMRLLRTELPSATLVVVAHREPQGLTDLVHVELSRPCTASTEGAADGRLLARMG